MARRFSGGVDCTGQQILNVRAQNLASVPGTPAGEGQFLYNTATKKWGYWNGTVWIYPDETGSITEATPTTLGTIKTTGDLGGTGGAPTVVHFTLTSNAAAGKHKITELAAPTAGEDAANKEYVDGKIPVAATSTTLGIIKTTGDLGGTGESPTVVHFTLISDSSAGTHKITNLGEPSASADAATKAYVDAKVNGISWKDAVDLATAVALAAYTQSGEGATGALEANANGALEVDGVAVAVGDRILVKNGAAEKDNGIYEVTQKGGATEKYKLLRTADANTVAELTDATCFAEQGATLEGHEFNQSGALTKVDGAEGTAIKFVDFQSGLLVKGDGTYITRTGNTIEILPDTALPGEPAEGAVEAVGVGVARKKTFRLRGKAGTTKYVLTHSLNTRHLCVQGMEMSGENPTIPIELDWEVTGVNTIEVTLPVAVAGTVNYGVVIIG